MEIQQYIKDKCVEIGLRPPTVSMNNGKGGLAYYNALTDRVVICRDFQRLSVKEQKVVACHELGHKTQRKKTLWLNSIGILSLLSLVPLSGSAIVLAHLGVMSWIISTILVVAGLLILHHFALDYTEYITLYKEIEADILGAKFYGCRDDYVAAMKTLWFGDWPPKAAVSLARYKAMGIIQS